MKQRKTIKIEVLLNRFNEFILHSKDDLSQSRETLSIQLERVLIEAGNYRGFRYLDKQDMKQSYEGTSVGINIDDTGKPLDDYSERYQDTDITRVQYSSY